MTTYYVEGTQAVVSFEVDPQTDINADAKIWTPYTEKWHDCPGSKGIGASVLWGGDYYPIPESAVPAMQTRARDAMKADDARDAAAKS